MDGVSLNIREEGGAIIDCVAENIEDPAQGHIADWNRNWFLEVHDGHAAG